MYRPGLARGKFLFTVFVTGCLICSVNASADDNNESGLAAFWFNGWHFVQNLFEPEENSSGEAETPTIENPQPSPAPAPIPEPPISAPSPVPSPVPNPGLVPAIEKPVLAPAPTTPNPVAPPAPAPQPEAPAPQPETPPPSPSQPEIPPAPAPQPETPPLAQPQPETPPPPVNPGPLPEPPGTGNESSEPATPLDVRGIVYTRQPRATHGVPGTGIAEVANWQHASDVGRINKLISEADVVFDDLQGNVKVIHNCTNSDEICIAQEARVSPDGTKVVYSVGYGSGLNEVRYQGIKLGIFDIIELTHAKLFIYDFASATSTPIPNHPQGAIDRQPEWLDNDTIVFSSNRAGLFPHKSQFSQHRGTDAAGKKRWGGTEYGISQPYGYTNSGEAMQIWRMDINGSNAVNLSPHETMALSPAIMSNGDIVYSCWNAHANEAFDSASNRASARGTEVNKWWLCQMDGNGAGGHVLLNAHKSPTLKTKILLAEDVVGGEGSSTLRAVRSAAEIGKDYMAVTNYYRGNHVGSMGIVYGMAYRTPGVEGVSYLRNYKHRLFDGTREGSGRYLPSDFIALTPYGNDQDTAHSRRDGQGRAMGKAGYASALPGTDDYMITHGRGICYEAVPIDQVNRTWTGGEPICQKEIYRVKTSMVTDPFDTDQMEFLAGGDAWHAFDADAVTTYQELWGQPLPKQPTPLPDGECFIQVVDAREAELQPALPYDWRTTLFSQCSSQGCAINSEDQDFHRENMHYLTVYEVGMWDKTYIGDDKEEFANTINNHGFKSLKVWGYQAIEEDGSARMQVPCETPIQIVGQDSSRLTIAHDDKTHSLRRGETRTCHGCHDGHSQERAQELGKSAEERFASTIAAGTDYGAPNNGYRTTWADVEPIFTGVCAECHEDMNNNDGLLDSRLSWDHQQLDWPWAEKKLSFNQDYNLPRPYTSKWVSKMARDSLLYWKCMGARQDGRTDDQYSNDIDFGEPHPVPTNVFDCLAIGQWIDQGIQRDPE